jgi:hypothetical protein
MLNTRTQERSSICSTVRRFCTCDITFRATLYISRPQCFGHQSGTNGSVTPTFPLAKLVRLAYQPPAHSTFLSKQISHQLPTSSTFLSEQTSTSHQPLAERTACKKGLKFKCRHSICKMATLHQGAPSCHSSRQQCPAPSALAQH